MERLLAQQQFAISTAQQQLAEFENIETNYKQLKERLQNLPKKLRHTVSVPLNSVGFFQGELIHTNEITVLLSSDYLVQVSASIASEIVDRRIEECRKRQEKAKEEIRHHSEWKAFTQRDFEEKTGAVDIREDFDEAEELRWRQHHAVRVRQERRRAQESTETLSDADSENALWERLEELEIQEQLEKYSAEVCGGSGTNARPLSSAQQTTPIEASSTAAESGAKPKKNILKRTLSTGSFKSVRFDENLEPETSVFSASGNDEKSDDDDDAFTGLIVERDLSGNIVATVGEPQVRVSRFKAFRE